MLYVGYGSSLSTKFMEPYCPSAKFVMRAVLPNFHIEFHKYSENLGGGISTIIEAPGEVVHCVVYEVPQEEIEAMDILEQVPEGVYKRETFLVLGEDGEWYKADLYRIVKAEGPIRPSKKYVGYMLEGMREHDIDADYMRKFQELYDSL